LPEEELLWSETETPGDISDDINASLFTCLWSSFEALLPLLPQSSAKFDGAVSCVPTYINKTKQEP
jgi:hypothetical protein